MTSTLSAPLRPAFSRRPRLAAAVIAGVVLGSAGIYGIGPSMRNAAADEGCGSAVELAQTLDPLAKGEVAAVKMATRPLKLPDLAFEDAGGQAKKLSDWRGRTVLLNLWATWCVPCRVEMPALDKLQGELGSDAFEVVAINIDTRNLDRPRTFFKDTHIAKLAYFADPKAKVFQDLKAAGRAEGMPTSILIDGKGCEIGTIAGPAEWASDDAIKLISAALKK